MVVIRAVLLETANQEVSNKLAVILMQIVRIENVPNKGQIMSQKSTVCHACVII